MSERSTGRNRLPPGRTLEEVERALALVERIDELVYKRKSLSRAPASQDQILSESNVEGLFRRVEIWERAARSPAPPRPHS